MFIPNKDQIKKELIQGTTTSGQVIELIDKVKKMARNLETTVKVF
jgi:hypothetical protein